MSKLPIPLWALAAPLAGLLPLASGATHSGAAWTVTMASLLLAAVFAGVHHADVVAHKNIRRPTCSLPSFRE